MIIKHLSLCDFRNYATLELDLHPSLTILLGDNGAGKTNILESLSVLSNTHSFRCHKDEEMIKKGSAFAKIEVSTEDDDFKIVISPKGKTLWLNEQMVKRSSDYIGKINTILFKPDDLFIFDAPPSSRRNLVDIEISKASSSYLQALLTYNKILKEKNTLLKQEKIDEKYLEILNDASIAPISKIIKERKKFITLMEEEIKRIFHLLSDLDLNLKITYKSCCSGKEEDIKEALLRSKEKDYIMHFATFGIQKEDITFSLNDYPISTYASQGQKRMVVIAFKIALTSYLKEMGKDKPIILLDDILSELDSANVMRLFKLLDYDFQTIITQTSIPESLNHSENKVITIKEGAIYGTN